MVTIDFTVKDYFEQLQLMEQQYGQEEDLYPWIYMLLQMVECRKKKENKNYKEVSIRDVHNWKKRKVSEEIKEPKNSILKAILPQKGGAPEFLLVDCEASKYLGCIEIKKLNGVEWIPLKETKEGTKDTVKVEPYIFEQGLEFEVLSFKEKKVIRQNLEDEKNIILTEIREKFKKNNIVPERMTCKYEKKGKRYTYTFEAIVYNLNITIDVPEMERTKEKMCCSDNEQLKKHLTRFGKVIYTNGKEFYYLRIKHTEENQQIIEVKKLADLTCIYNRFEKEKDSQEWKLDASKEWCQLITELQGINWYEEPMKIVNKREKI